MRHADCEQMSTQQLLNYAKHLGRVAIPWRRRNRQEIPEEEFRETLIARIRCAEAYRDARDYVRRTGRGILRPWSTSDTFHR